MTQQDHAALLIAAIRGEIGYHEGRSGGHWNNKEKYANEIVLPDGSRPLAWVNAGGYAWCAVFDCWGLWKADALQYLPGGPTASVAHLRDAAKAAGRFNEYPAIGALALFGVHGDEHTGPVVDFGPGTVTTVEGNTNDNGSAEGDGVYLHTRQRTDPRVFGYVYPTYPEGLDSADPAFPKKQTLHLPPTRVTEARADVRHAVGRLKEAERLQGRVGAVHTARVALEGWLRTSVKR